VTGWWLLPQLAVHACFAVGAGILSGFAELTRPVAPTLVGRFPDGGLLFDGYDYFPDRLIAEVSASPGLWDRAPLHKEWPA
jgi:hypothetical protein